MALPNTPARVVYSDSDNQKSFAVGVDGNTYINNIVFPDGTEQSSVLNSSAASGLTITDAIGATVPQTSVDLVTANPPQSPAGTLQFLRRTWWNNSGVSMPAMKGRFLSVVHGPGLGGTSSSATQQSSAVGVKWDNSFSGCSQDYIQELTSYMEFVISGTPTFHGHAGGETDCSVYRGNLTDSRSGFGGNAPSVMCVYSAQIERDNAGAQVSTSGGTWACYRGYISNEAAGTLSGTQSFTNFLAQADAGNGFTSAPNVLYAGFKALAPGSRFPNTYGVWITSFGTNTADFNIRSDGDMATSAGMNSFTGPVILATRTPASTNAVGVKGTITWDAGFIYVCTATNKWGRAALDFNF